MRCAVEAPYTISIASLLDDDMACEGYHSVKLLFATERQLLEGRTGLPRVVTVYANPDYNQNYVEPKFELKMRPAKGVFVAYHKRGV